MAKRQLPKPIREFIARQPTIALETIEAETPEEKHSTYGTFYYRAVACILLSGRVDPKADDDPNLTDANRFGKEANFNQYLTERVGKLLVAMDVVKADRRQGHYVAGPHLDAFWDHDVEQLGKISRKAVLRLSRKSSGYGHWYKADEADQLHLIEFLTLFLGCFRDVAIAEPALGQVLRDFAKLPQDDLIAGARALGLEMREDHVAGWKGAIDEKVLDKLIPALGISEWMHYTEHEKKIWLMASPIGLAMVGLRKPLPAPKLASAFKVQSDLSVFAGAGLPHRKLLPFFRFAIVKRIDEVYEFRLDRRRFNQVPSTASPAGELRQALVDLEPLPGTVAKLLEAEPRRGGEIGVKYCSALLKPEDDEVLEAIRKHPKLKGYLEPGAPAGYLLIKPQSRPDNFVFRCRDLGFKVTLI
jgi:hypothetical protein